jgi:hypothetical protein
MLHRSVLRDMLSRPLARRLATNAQSVHMLVSGDSTLLRITDRLVACLLPEELTTLAANLLGVYDSCKTAPPANYGPLMAKVLDTADGLMRTALGAFKVGGVPYFLLGGLCLGVTSVISIICKVL